MAAADWRSLLAGAPARVAPRLLGATVRHGEVAVRLTEVEAYAGEQDPASHAWRGRTPRTEVMFGPAGHLYVYFTYGMHYCANVVCGPQGQASAVLLRAGEVVAGHELARDRRGPRVRDVDLARGPARLCAALGLDRQHDGVDLLSAEPAGPRLELALRPVPVRQVRSGPRVGVTRATEVAWRYWIDGEPTVSAYRPGRQSRRSGQVDT
ncbi:MAG: DNA-3-methyladenine glycosylase [Nocardioides sp.]